MAEEEQHEESKLVVETKMTAGVFHDMLEEKLDEFLTENFSEGFTRELTYSEWLEEFQQKLAE